MITGGGSNLKYLNFARPVSKRSIENLMISLKSANAHDCVYVDSPGGEFEFFSVFAPVIRRMGINTIGGDVRSAAVLLLLLGQYRYALPDSSFFFHEVRALVGNPCNSNNMVTICDLDYVQDFYKDQIEGQEKEIMQEWHRRMQAAQTWFLQFISEATLVPIPTFLSFMRGNTTLSAREAQRYGIVHRVISEDELRSI